MEAKEAREEKKNKKVPIRDGHIRFPL